MIHRSPILLVEDNPDDVMLTLRAFTRNQILNPVVVARDGAEALDWLRGTGDFCGRDPEDQPAFVLLDLQLPRLPGLDVLQALREDSRTRLLRVVVLTTSREDEDLVESYRLGANSYIRKPVDLDEFTAVVGQLGLYWLVLNEPVPHRR